MNKPRQNIAENVGATFSWLTQLAFVLIIALGAARATMVESMRDPTPVLPGTPGAPRGPGPCTSLVLDLLCCVPALLILVRRVADPAYVLRFTIAHAILLMLALWAVLSTFWSVDKFTAAITASHLLSAAVMFWAASQLVRSWLRLRLIAATCLGLVLIYTAHGMIYRLVDLPDTIAEWQKTREKQLAERGWAPDSFEARQFEQKLMHGEMIGFAASPNTFAAMIVLLGIVSTGAAIQRIVGRDEWGWPIVILAPLPLAAWVMWFTHSNTAMITPILATILLIAIARWRSWLVAHRKLAFAACVFAVVLGTLAIIGHGISHGTLPTDSMRFRWRYWTASMRIVRQHPLIGVGWSNFAPYYLAVRLPEAAEEIRDPHNLLVRVLVELGVVGAALLLVWLLRGAWELTAPTVPPSPAKPQAAYGRWHAFKTIAGIALGAMLINTLASIDLSQSAAFVTLEILRRVLYAGLLMLGIAVVSLRSSKNAVLDDRPAAWILWSVLVALAIFLLHNTIDFSLFENGPLMVFMLLAGAALGVRSPSVADKPKRTPIVWTALLGGCVALATAAIAFVVPICDAEARADAGDAAIRKGNFALAAADFKAAFNNAPLRNSDYAARAAEALIFMPKADAQTRAMLAQAIATNPLDPGHLLLRGHYFLHRHPAEHEQIRDDFTRALEIDPNNVAVRIEFAKALESFGDVNGATQQYRRAIELNDKLDAKEPKRLSPNQREEIEQKLH